MNITNKYSDSPKQEGKRTEVDAELPTTDPKRAKPRCSLLYKQAVKRISVDFNRLVINYKHNRGVTRASWLAWFDRLFCDLSQLDWTITSLLVGIGLGPTRSLRTIFTISSTRQEIAAEIVGLKQDLGALDPLTLVNLKRAVLLVARHLPLFIAYAHPLMDFPVDGTLKMFKDQGLGIALLSLDEVTRLLSASLFSVHELLRFGRIECVDTSVLPDSLPQDSTGRTRFACSCGNCEAFLPANYIGPDQCSHCSCGAEDHSLTFRFNT